MDKIEFEFEIAWRYLLENNGEEKVFTQKIKLKKEQSTVKVETPSLCMGMHIANLYSACKVDSEIPGYQDSPAYREWSNIVGRNYLRLNNKKSRAANMLFDSIAYPAFCIFKNVSTMLEEIGGGIENAKWFSQCTHRILGDLTDGNFTIDQADFEEKVQECINKYLVQYNNLLMSSRGKFNKEFYDRLCECLREYNESKLIGEYLAKQEEKGRCFATFIEDETNKKYIAFSGFVDAEDDKILKWLNRSKKESEEFVKIAKAICFSMDKAEFVPTNLATRRYYCEKYSPFTVIQGPSLNDAIDNNLKSMRRYYSCCERKIFGRFKDKTPNGKLYVKLKICGECSLGLYYQYSKGSKIDLFDSLEC